MLSFPSDRRLREADPARLAPDPPEQREKPPPDTPLDAPSGPIEHVFYIVRENRTYDQILGDDPRGDGDPKLDPVRRGR